MTTPWLPLVRLRPLWIALWMLCAALPGRAAVLKVDPLGGAGVFTSIQAAVDAAQSGDTILVKGQNVYAGFVIDGKGLQLVVDADQRADVEFESGPGIVIRNLPAGQPVVLRGLRSRPASFPLGDPEDEGLAVENCTADVWLEDCTFAGANGFSNLPTIHKPGWSGARVTGSNSVAFVRCSLEGGTGFSPSTFFAPPQSAGSGAHGIDATSSTVYVYDSLASGGSGGTVTGFATSTFPGGSGGHGAVLDGTFLFASGSPCAGGGGGSGGYHAGSGVCGAGGPGGDGLHLSANAPSAVRLDSPAVGGAGGIGGGGQGGPSGCAPAGVAGQAVTVQPGGVAVVASGAARSLVQSAVTREQGSLTLTVQGESGDTVFLLVGLSQDSSWIPKFKGGLLPSKTPLITIGLGTMPLSGVMPFDFTIPELGPGFEAIWIYDQAALFSGTDGWVLASPSASLLLDQSL